MKRVLCITVSNEFPISNLSAQVNNWLVLNIFIFIFRKLYANRLVVNSLFQPNNNQYKFTFYTCVWVNLNNHRIPIIKIKIASWNPH